jgi:hypothetical protein
MTIKGIDILIEDEGTGAQAHFHQIAWYSVDPRAGQTTTHVSGYVSESKQVAGRNPLMQRSITIYGVPVRGGDAMDWIYTELVKPVSVSPPGEIIPGMPMPAMPDLRSAFAGGELVTDAAPG